ncbi:Sodium/hydrogen exchanger 7 [Acorus calamus]|uniref:Sodium/hydrogen exchanger 7 n=1 Tax=Acorus calamus TaxID=4465 RepID=A0AAV9EMN4_ACOCL|nr:Sodium/hydrogen exchanger 7 [Acorus calamus]
MAAVVVAADGPIIGNASSSGTSESPLPEDAVVFFGLSLVLGIASRHLLRGTRVPYTVALLVLGITLGR